MTAPEYLARTREAREVALEVLEGLRGKIEPLRNNSDSGDRLSMGTWSRPLCDDTGRACGTAACLGGWLVRSGALVPYGLLPGMTGAYDQYQPKAYGSEFPASGLGLLVGMYALAAVLGLTLKEARNVFGAHNKNDLQAGIARLRKAHEANL